MDIMTALHSQLVSSTNITVYSSQRVYPMVVPDGVKKPYITIHQISDIPTHAMGSDAKIEYYRFQVSSWTTSYSQLISLSTAIKSNLRDLSGTLGSSNFNVQRIFLDMQNDFPEYNPETKTIIYHRAQDFLIWTTG